MLEVVGLVLGDQVAVARLDEQDADAAVAEQVGGLLRTGAEVHRHDGGADERTAEDGLHALHAVGGEDADPVADAHAEHGQHAGSAAHVVEQILVGHFASRAAAGFRRGVDQDDLFASNGRWHEEQHSQIHVDPLVSAARGPSPQSQRQMIAQCPPAVCRCRPARSGASGNTVCRASCAADSP